MQWIVDGTVHISTICQQARWRWRDCVAALVAAGLSDEDAVTYAGFCFGEDLVYQRAVNDEALDPEYYARLSVAASVPPLHRAPPDL